MVCQIKLIHHPFYGFISDIRSSKLLVALTQWSLSPNATNFQPLFFATNKIIWTCKGKKILSFCTDRNHLSKWSSASLCSQKSLTNNDVLDWQDIFFHSKKWLFFTHFRKGFSWYYYYYYWWLWLAICLCSAVHHLSQLTNSAWHRTSDNNQTKK